MASKVKLVGMTSPSASSGCHTAGDLIAYAARVSNPMNQNNKKTASKLLRYLIKEGHWSPFEMVSITMEITTTRDISRQILRHRSFSFQEFSQRYAVSETFSTKREARKQHATNRQLSMVDENSERQDKAQEVFNDMQSEVARVAKDYYEMALNSGIAKEQARALLPEGLTETTLYMAGTLRSWLHYCELRRGHGTQKEHIDIADQCWDIISGHFPDIAEALND
ncbi:FAD-dependent thymidylate synthase [bacterium]|jgi:thymidylate synthase (FAD)|nr:FAD-dependent thymidylate synthase [bacterium]